MSSPSHLHLLPLSKRPLSLSLSNSKRLVDMSGTEQAMAGAGRATLTASTGIMIAGVITSFALFILIFYLFLRAKRYWGAISVSVPPGPTGPAPAAQPRGLDAAAVTALPWVVVHAADRGEGTNDDCAVCLCELAEGEAARLLPRCGHAFHLGCIDTWFSSHSTCPLCRSAVVAEKPPEDACSAAHPEEPSPQIPADGLPARAAEEGSSSSSSAGIEVEAPSSPLPASVPLEEAVARSPAAAALRSLRRLLIRASGSPRGCDVEQGFFVASKAPTSS
ncbi:RING-H2 finger protein ATL3-like [Canna indica]|uniref:RING-type E3 ubiquitin transferase n=1 Tax=Canna indica TaxID=4628 RepID=A0AAQ3JY84_9LILI|nr:RING-H2 finger protein ATL3-like [Canna indica]